MPCCCCCSFRFLSALSISCKKKEKKLLVKTKPPCTEKGSYGFQRNNHKRKWPLYFYETICNFSTLCLTLVLLTHSFFSTFPHFTWSFSLYFHSPFFIHRSPDAVCLLSAMILYASMYSFSLLFTTHSSPVIHTT